MKRIALILPNNIWVSPYLFIYTRIFDALGVKYDIISWNREGRKEEGIQYQYREKSRNQLSVLWSYMKYASFLKKIIKKNDYEKLVVFTPQVGIFLSSFLKKRFKGRYIIDYRDLSLEQKPFFVKKFCVVLSNSYINVISSPGFKRFLPEGFDYLVSHNFNIEIVKKAIKEEPNPFDEKQITVLTIGALRKDMNPEVMEALGNNPYYKLSFVGKGISAEYLEKYAISKGYNNVEFTGFYRKENEPAIYKTASFINIVYPLIPSHISALSNRFYNSLIYKRPMIVTKNTIQGEYAQQFGVGLVIEDCNNLSEKIIEYMNNLDYIEYAKRCNILLEKFLDDNIIFEKKIKDFCQLLKC